MRKIVLIAAMVLTSAAAQAGEMRNLSTGAPSDALAPVRTQQLQAQNDASVATPAKPADAPSYTARPAAVDTAPSAEHPDRRYDDKGYFDNAGYHPFPRRYASDDRHASDDRPVERPRAHSNRSSHRARWDADRIIGELHRYGV